MDILANVLEAVAHSANAQLQAIDPRADDWLILTSIVDHDGASSQEARDKIVMQVHGIREAAILRQSPTIATPRGAAAPLHIEIDLIFTANFTGLNYRDGLAALSRLMAYFHATPVFTPATLPHVAPGIASVAVDLRTQTIADTESIIGMLGGRYLPSLFYRLRIVPA